MTCPAVLLEAASVGGVHCLPWHRAGKSDDFLRSCDSIPPRPFGRLQELSRKIQLSRKLSSETGTYSGSAKNMLLEPKKNSELKKTHILYQSSCENVEVCLRDLIFS